MALSTFSTKKGTDLFRWSTVTIDLAAAICLAEYWQHGKWPEFIRSVAAAAVETVVYRHNTAIKNKEW